MLDIKETKHNWVGRVACMLAFLSVLGFLFNTFVAQYYPIKLAKIIQETVAVAKVLTGDDILAQVDASSLNSTQLKLLELAKQEYATGATSFDDTVLKYTEGFEEAWCGDFVSWLRSEAGEPFINQETGYWRIPGVNSLMVYYQNYGLYHAIGDSYSPKLGDLAFYIGETPDGESTQHVAMVLGVKNGKLITIGGNEGIGDGIVQVRMDELKQGTKGLVGIGESNI